MEAAPPVQKEEIDDLARKDTDIIDTAAFTVVGGRFKLQTRRQSKGLAYFNRSNPN
jgi:hypothetical protein